MASFYIIYVQKSHLMYNLCCVKVVRGQEMDNCNNYLTLSKCTVVFQNQIFKLFDCVLSNIGSLNGMIKYVPTYSIEILSRNAKRNNCTKSKSNPNKASIRQSLNSASSFQVYLVAEDLGEGPYLSTYQTQPAINYLSALLHM